MLYTIIYLMVFPFLSAISMSLIIVFFMVEPVAKVSEIKIVALSGKASNFSYEIVASKPFLVPSE